MDKFCRYVGMISPISSQPMSSFVGSGLMSGATAPRNIEKFYIYSDVTHTYIYINLLHINIDNIHISTFIKTFFLI